jgi:hypothetical protein
VSPLSPRETGPERPKKGEQIMGTEDKPRWIVGSLGNFNLKKPWIVADSWKPGAFFGFFENEAEAATAALKAECNIERHIDFGVCPRCGKNDGYINVGQGHWFFCKEHKVRWFVGLNLYPGWQYETREEQERVYNELGFGEFTVIVQTKAAGEELVIDEKYYRDTEAMRKGERQAGKEQGI